MGIVVMAGGYFLWRDPTTTEQYDVTW